MDTIFLSSTENLQYLTISNSIDDVLFYLVAYFDRFSYCQNIRLFISELSSTYLYIYIYILVGCPGHMNISFVSPVSIESTRLPWTILSGRLNVFCLLGSHGAH